MIFTIFVSYQSCNVPLNLYCKFAKGTTQQLLWVPWIISRTGTVKTQFNKLCPFLFLDFLDTVVIFYINSVSVTWTTRVQVFLTIAKVIGLAIIIFTGIVMLFKGNGSPLILFRHANLPRFPAFHKMHCNYPECRT